jgi:hypothetical protein
MTDDPRNRIPLKHPAPARLQPLTLPAPPEPVLGPDGDPIVDDTRGSVVRVNREIKGRTVRWAYVSASALDVSPDVLAESFLSPHTLGGPIDAQVRARFGARDDAPVCVSPDHHVFAVWMPEGEPTEEPVFPAPKSDRKLWVFVAKAFLAKRARTHLAPSAEINPVAEALRFFGMPESTPYEENEQLVALWLHDSAPEPIEWPESPEIRP